MTPEEIIKYATNNPHLFDLFVFIDEDSGERITYEKFIEIARFAEENTKQVKMEAA